MTKGRRASTGGVAEVLRGIDEAAQRGFLPIVGPQKGRLLQELVEAHRPQRVLEVGTLVGYSAILMASSLPAESRVWTIEINPRAIAMASENIRRAGLEDRIEIIPGDALEVIPRLTGPFQMVFLDATKEEYLDYLISAEPQIPAGGVVVADNAGIFAQAMKPYLDYVRQSGKYSSRSYDFGFDAMEVSVRLA